MAKRLPLVFEGGEIIESKATDTTDLGNGVITAAGGDTERNLKDILGDAINVKDYGAKGDGTTDDTEAFQKAALAAAAKGGVIYVPHGTYKVTETINGEFISYGHPQFVGSAASAMTNKLTDLYDDYVHKTKNVNETITGTKTFSSSPLVPTPAATDNSQKAMNTAWLRNAVSGDSTGLSFDSNGKLKVDPSGMSPEAIKALIKSLLPGNGTDGSDGFVVDESTGKLKVKPSELISGTDSDGLGVDGNGKIKVVPSELAGTGLTGNDSTGKITVNVSDLIPGTTTDGFEVTSGKLKVKPDEFAGDGLSVKNGKLTVDFEELNPDEVVDIMEPVLNAMEMQIPLKKNLTLYVNSGNATTINITKNTGTASDPIWTTTATNIGAGVDPQIDSTHGFDVFKINASKYWGEDLEHPWKTIQACVDFVSKYLSLGKYNIYIRLVGGTFTLTSTLMLGNYTASTGSIAIYPLIQDASKATVRYKDSVNQRYPNVIIKMEQPGGGICQVNSGGRWTIGYVKLVRTFVSPENDKTVYAYIAETTDTGSFLNLEGCSVNYTVNTTNTSTSTYKGKSRIYCFYVTTDTTVQLANGTSFDSGNIGNSAVVNDLLYVFNVTSGRIIMKGAADANSAIYPVSNSLKFQDFMHLGGDGRFSTSTSANDYEGFFIVFNSNNTPITNNTIATSTVQNYNNESVTLASRRYLVGSRALASPNTGHPDAEAYSSLTFSNATVFPGADNSGVIDNPSGISYLSTLNARITALETA